MGMNLVFLPDDSGGVKCLFQPSDSFQGYDGLVHGGVIAALLDGAMTNCLFAYGHEALTAELKVRYRQPVLVDDEITVRAWIAKNSTRLYQMQAELVQNNCVKVIATAKFMEKV